MVAPATWGGPAQPDYETLLELGEGGMAIAYLARTLGAGGFERWVVLKRLNLELLANPEAIERFLAEARIAARIHHANVVGTQHVGRDAAGPFIVLDYVEGGAVDELVNASVRLGAPLAPGVVLRIALDALSGLQAVHEAKDPSGRPLEILHRDISLENVLVSVHDGVARLSDFGVARSVLSPVRTSPGYFVGKLLYLAPEYLRRQPVGPTLDLYALGVTLWLALVGERPWRDLGDGQIVSAIVEDGFPDLPAQLAVPEAIRALVAKACAREPAQRFQSAREMKAALERFEREQGGIASHAEVAECVGRLLGTALQHRRLALTERRREPTPPLQEPSRERPIDGSAATVLPPAQGAKDLSPSAELVPSRDVAPDRTVVLPAPAAKPRASVAEPPRRRRSRTATRLFATGWAVVAAGALAAALIASREQGDDAPARPVTVRAFEPPPAASPQAPAPVPEVPAVVPLPPAPAPSPPPASATATLGPPPRRAPPSVRASVRPSVPATVPPVPPTVVAAPSAATSDGIQKRNPYR